ncbi:MAG: MFS transporter, partial [Candidatus Ornithospirochaeta sp.]
KLKKKGRITSTGILFISAVGLVVRLLLYLVPGIVAFTIAQTLHGLSFGALHLAATSYTADNVDESHYDLGMTFYWSVATNLPEMLGALAGGFVIEKFGYPALFLSYSFFPLVAAVLALVFASLLKGEKR